MKGVHAASRDRHETQKSPSSLDHTDLGKPATNLDSDQIREILPHRFPFLFVDRITRLEERYAHGIKNVTISEPCFQGHIPGHPVMPGVLILEAIAQVGAILVLTETGNKGKLPYMLSIEKAKFRRAIRPGDQMEIEVEVISLRKKHGRLRGEVRVNGKLSAETEMTFVIVEEPGLARPPLPKSY